MYSTRRNAALAEKLSWRHLLLPRARRLLPHRLLAPHGTCHSSHWRLLLLLYSIRSLMVMLGHISSLHAWEPLKAWSHVTTSLTGSTTLLGLLLLLLLLTGVHSLHAEHSHTTSLAHLTLLLLLDKLLLG